MADHHAKALDCLADAERVGAHLRSAMRSTQPDRTNIANLSNRKRAAVKEAEVHAQLATAQALRDLYALLDSRLRRS